MADFSFSFDSDNPFAEPEQAPKKPTAPDGTTTDETAANIADDVAEMTPLSVHNSEEAANDEFSLSAFDFDGDVSINHDLTEQTSGLSEATPPQLTPDEVASAESDVSASDGLEMLAPEAPDQSSPFGEFEAPTEVETVAPVAKSGKASAKTTRSDLEEFNALTFGFSMPSEESEVTDEVEFVSTDEIETETETEIEPFAQDTIAEEHVAQAQPLAEPISEIGVPAAVAAPVAVAPLENSTQNTLQGQSEGEVRRLRTKTTMNVAILGASGIGKNHARWFARHGCYISSFLGTSEDSTAQTGTDLSAEFDFQVNSYTDLETLLQTERPDIVCVATPPPLHFGHVLQCLEAGAHVLCEKPLVYAPTRKFRENRDGAKELVKVAAKRNLNLGTQLQYGAATPILCKLAGLSPADVGDFAMELETLNPNASRDARELWIDLGPHPVSVAQMLAGPDAHLAEETIRFEPYQDDEKTEVLARFGINCADGRLLMVRAVVRALHGETTRQPRRRFSFNGHSVSYAPLASAKNGFQAQFVAPDGYASIYPDPVDYLIGNFVNACRNGHAPLITGDFGRENLEWMLKVGMLEEAR